MRHLYLTVLPDRTLFAALDEEFLPERAYLSHRGDKFKFSTEETELSREIEDETLLEARKTLERNVGEVLGEKPRLLRVEEREDLPKGRAVEVYGRGGTKEIFVGKVELGEEVLLASRGTGSEEAKEVTEVAERVLSGLLGRVIDLYYS
ncbi:hypothetical protein [Methanopyrus kandleri]|uniref:Uncharacterized protein n=1 Tax=Methanopyrus kandleri TaxID=2320 RepID=A0A832WA18_9EURY|nr:hypothetical protein [Methanopyrus kandleri]HII69648.1 hypothetical protein [Methanopyrus kandleri]